LGGAGAEWRQARGAGTAEDVGDERAGAGRERIAQHDVGVVGELVELAAAGESGAIQTVLRPGTADAHADFGLDPVVAIDRTRPAEVPARRAGGVHIRGTGV